jgi:hypothetical protein
MDRTKVTTEMGIGDWGLGIGDWANPHSQKIIFKIIFISL